MRRTIALLVLLAGTLSASARDSVDHWFEVRTQHFVVLTDTNEKQGVRVAAQFERMRSVFHLLMPTASDSAGSPIIVLALKDRKALQALEPEVYLAKGQLDLAGLFMRAPDKNYILLRTDAQGDHPFATVYHEYPHFMMRNASEDDVVELLDERGIVGATDIPSRRRKEEPACRAGYFSVSR